MSLRPTTNVVAAILERDGRILIGQRRADQTHALLWEFPGGKIERGETPDRALARELEEELSIQNARGEELMRYEYAYPGKHPIGLIFFRVTAYEGEIRDRIYRETRWVSRVELRTYDFVAGDGRFLDWFTGGPELGPGNDVRPAC